ncbi:MAG: glycosyltransferase, partial [Treponema sp.]|nr:glycosyltransferase [Treponema sp.]
MVIVIVEDNYLHETDGTAVSTHRFREELIKRGHTVRIIAIGVKGKYMYSLKEKYVPIATPVASRNNMHFARFDKKIVTEAFTGADLVHLIFPWQVHGKCCKLAKKMGIPVSAAFHCQPENVTYNMMIKLLGVANTFLYFLFRTWLYRNIENIHCPSQFIANELKKHKYRARLHVISNGIVDVFKPPREPVVRTDDKINVLMIGRLAEEKQQDLIIKAVKHSKYRDRIQLYFAGRGPMYKRYLRMSKGLPNPPVFDFFPQDKLLDLIYRTDVYIHASDAEVEGISCIEAFSCGKVPVISDSVKSATAQFALDERSLFKKGKYLDLRDKMEYWIEHPEERERMGKEYAKLGELYNINHSIKKLEKLFDATIKDFKTKQMIQENKELRKFNNRLLRSNHVKEFFCRVFYFCIAMPILILINRCFFGLKIQNKKNLKKIKGTGAVAICNHVHQMDCTICAVAFTNRKLMFVSQPSNFSLAIAGLFVDILGSVPTPSTPKEIQSFMYTLSKHLRNRRVVLFYPEGERVNYATGLRSFQRGPFYLAIDAQVPVLPMKIIYRPPDGLLKHFKKNPCLTLVIGDPIYPNSLLLNNDAEADIK